MIERVTMPVISTAHLTAQEGSTPAKYWPTHCLESEYGFVVHVEGVALGEEDIDAGEWTGLEAVAEWAHSLGYRYVFFDRDADIVEGLKKYEW